VKHEQPLAATAWQPVFGGIFAFFLIAKIVTEAQDAATRR